MEDIDDDFGDLYAGVEFQANAINNGITSNGDFNAESVNSGSKEVEELIIQDDEASTASSDCEREVCMDNVSDSEDDLNIVLNDDEEAGRVQGFSVSRGGNVRSGWFDEGDEVGGDFEAVAVSAGLVKNGNLVGQSMLSDGLDPSPKSCPVGEKMNGCKGGYQSQYLPYKYTRSRGASYATNAKANGFTGLGSYSSTSVRGDQDDNKCSFRMDSNALEAQIGHKFSLPSYRTILDVNISAFERKSWRQPGVDITNYFNFGFDEESWKLYCNSLDQLRQHTSLLNRTPTYGYSKAEEVNEAEAEYETGARNDGPAKYRHQEAVSPKLRSAYGERKLFKMPKGRGIQVEHSILERRPTMDVRRVVDRDPDVVIQIAVQDCVEDSSGSVKEESKHKGSVSEASEDVDFGLDDDTRHFGGGSGDELSSKLLERDVKRSGKPHPKRYSQLSTSSNPVLMDLADHASGQIADVNEHCYQKVTGSSSEAQAESMETSIKTNEKVCSETCNAALSLGETESLLGDQAQQEPSSSISVSRFESENFTSTDPVRLQNHPRKKSQNFVGELQESQTSDYHQSINSKIHQCKAKTRDVKHCSRNRSPFPKDRRHYSKRHHNGFELKNHYNCEESYPFLYTDDVHYKRLQGFDTYDGEGFPYCIESEFPFHYYGESFFYNEVRAPYSKRPHRNHLRFGDETDRYPSRRGEEPEYFHGQRGSRVDDEVVGRDWYHKERRTILNPPFCKETRGLGSNYSSYSDKERLIRWRGKGNKYQSSKRIREVDYVLGSIYGDDFVQEKYGHSGKERKYLHGKYESHWPSAGRGEKMDGSDFSKEPRTANRGREYETISPRNAYDLRATERDGKHSRRQISKERNRGINHFGSNHFAGDSEGRGYYPDDHVHYGSRRNWQDDLFQCANDEYIYSYKDDDFLTEAASFSFENTIRNERIGGKQKLMDNVEVEQRRIKALREGCGNNRIGRSSNITDRCNHGKSVPLCRDSVDLQLFGGEGKSSSGRWSNAESIEFNDMRDEMVNADRSESHAEKGVRTKSAKVEIHQSAEKCLDKFPITEQDETLDIEEGQIVVVTKEVNENNNNNNTPCVNFGSENAAEIRDDKEKRVLVENARDGNNVGMSPWILAVMAKMEKRRERFKEPIGLKKEIDFIVPKSEVETMETKRQRPVRKRRWGGS